MAVVRQKNFTYAINFVILLLNEGLCERCIIKSYKVGRPYEKGSIR